LIRLLFFPYLKGEGGKGGEMGGKGGGKAYFL